MVNPFQLKARHAVLSILFVTWIVCFMDRIAISVAVPYIASEFHLSPLEMGGVLSAFFAAYSISQIPGGILADLFGVRRVATIAMLWWSALTAATGVAANLTQMLVVRFAFGLGEGVFPACAFKTIAVWFPKTERATANAIMIAANPLGAALSPLAVVAIMSVWGWRAVFLCLLVPGVAVALLFWKFVPNGPSESHRISREELREIEQGGGDFEQGIEKKAKLVSILKERYILKLFVALFPFDLVAWGYFLWLPTYLVKAKGFSMVQMGVAASMPFFGAAIGKIAGGWCSDRYFRNRRRLLIVVTQLVSALFLYLTFTANSTDSLVASQTLAGLFLGVAESAFWALPMNFVSKELMGVASGFINMAGTMAGFVAPLLMGYFIDITGGFGLDFDFLIGSLFVSAAIVSTISPAQQRRGQEVVYR